MTKLTIVCITYNHEKYIAQTIESFLSQKTDFEYEIIIGDDASSDSTPEIIQDFASKFPDKIKPILRKKNLGIRENYVQSLALARSEYVLYNEGDDFFSDELKLQKQVDFLDANPDFSICFHPVHVIWENNVEKDFIFPSEDLRFCNTVLTFEDMLRHNFIQTNSCMYRWIFNGSKSISEIFPKDILPCDYFLHLLHAQQGKIGFIPDVMASYRKHLGGVWAGCGVTDEWFARCGIEHLNFYIEIENFFSCEKTAEKNSLAHGLVASLIKTQNRRLLERMLEKHHDLLFLQLNEVAKISNATIQIKQNLKKSYVYSLVKYLVARIKRLLK